MENRRYHGKVILFGEYSMIFGSEALLIPYEAVYGEWSSVINRPSERAFDSNKNIYKLYNYIIENERFRILDLRRFEMELNAGLFFDSNIREGYGIGSSGALVAAIYDRYKLVDIEDIDRLRRFLAEMENYFHGSSSGIDPLQCYIGEPFIMSCRPSVSGQQSAFDKLSHDFISEDIHIFLIDTKIKSHTGPLVEHFKELRNDISYLDRFNNEYVPTVSRCISSLVEKDDEGFFMNLSCLSKLQHEMLSHTIPEGFKDLFLKDINKDGFQVKLCGAGGGGFLLGFCKDIEATNELHRSSGLKITWIK